MIHIFVISDGKYKAAKRLLEVALTQFPSQEYNIKPIPRFQNRKNIQTSINKFTPYHSLSSRPLDSLTLKKNIIRSKKNHDVEQINFSKSFFGQLSQLFHNLSVKRLLIFCCAQNDDLDKTPKNYAQNKFLDAIKLYSLKLSG